MTEKDFELHKELTDNEPEQNDVTRPKTRQENMGRKSFLMGVVGGLVGATLIVGGYAMTQMFGTQTVSTNKSTPIALSNQTVTSTEDNAVTAAVNNVQDAIVSIVNYQQQTRGNDIFGYLLSNDASELVKAGEGSGVIYKKEGNTAYLITNNHVIEGADDLNVILRNGETIQAELVGTDALTDLAVLKIDGTNVTTVATLADSSQVNVGQTVLAIGSPLGHQLATSVTKGIVSATNRSVDVDTDGDKRDDWTMEAIQTDAAINPGNSGGALVDLNGHVVGINSMKISSTAVEGIGFAIPSQHVQHIVNQLETEGKVSRLTLGVQMIDLKQVSINQREQILHLPDTVDTGVVIGGIQEKSVAALSGLQKYDVITEWDGQSVANGMALRKYLYNTKMGDSITLTVYREGQKQSVRVTFTP